MSQKEAKKRDDIETTIRDLHIARAHESETKVRGRLRDNLRPRLAELGAEETFHGLMDTWRFNNHPLKGVTLRVRTMRNLKGVPFKHEWGGKINTNGNTVDWLKERDEFGGSADTHTDALRKLAEYAPRIGISRHVVDSCTLFDRRERRTHAIPNQKGKSKKFEPMKLDDDTYVRVNSTTLARRRRLFEIEDPTEIVNGVTKGMKRKRVMRLIRVLGLMPRFNPLTAGFSSERYLVDEGVLIRSSRVAPGVGKEE